MVTLANVERYERTAIPSVGERAVVVGGSMAGLCAGRVLADGFEEVVVLERDSLPEEPVAREGAPQTSHPHILLEAGRATLEDLFPGFCKTVLSEGGLMIDGSTEVKYYRDGGFLAAGPNRLAVYCASRPLFESVVRQRVRSLDNLQLRGECQFTSYRTDETGTAVTGVEFRDETGEVTALETDLVVDATGRASRTPAWLDSHGYESPPVDEVSIDMCYSTIRVERPPDDRLALIAPAAHPRTRGAAAFPIEGNRWDVILQGVHGDTPPTDPDELVAFAQSLPIEEIGTIVTDHQWTSDRVHSYPFPASIRRRYEQLDRFPRGLVVTGDALASFNPVYGQGMSVATLDALLLHHSLAAGGLDDLAERYFERTARLVETAWKMAVGADFGFPQTAGPKPRGTDFFNWYLSRLARQAHTDGVLNDAFSRVYRLEQPPTALLRPRIVWRVFRPTPTASRT